MEAVSRADRQRNSVSSLTMLLGQSVPRREGRAKVTGRAQYVDDLVLPGMLFGATVRSAEPRGFIKRIEFGPDISWSDFVVVTAADIPGVNRVALIVDDQPCLAADRVNHPEEPVVLLAHADRHVLEEARRHVRIDLDPEPAVFTMDEALDGRAIVWGRDNIFKNYEVTRGDVDAAFASADLVVEGEYETGAQEQLYIEPNGMVATANPTDGVTVWGSMQCPYYIHKALKALFNLPADKVRVVQMETGGGFGGKEEYPSIIACHAALLAWKSGKPVKLVYDRAEDMVATTKRHPSRTRHRTAVDARGPSGRDGRRLRHRRRRLLHAVACRACRAARFTRRGRTCARTCGCAGVRSRPTRRRTGHSVDSARRRACSRSSGTWTASRPLSDSRQTSSGGAISFAPATRVPSAR